MLAPGEWLTPQGLIGDPALIYGPSKAGLKQPRGGMNIEYRIPLKEVGTDKECRIKK
ncbi:unnamed protein product [marine sediment metagenome]|uniref:Uncharacterized protein n=1 Tax=marine sediment metagenome TaxID=412755 RepID=X0XD16_9ZZZZ